MDDNRTCVGVLVYLIKLHTTFKSKYGVFVSIMNTSITIHYILFNRTSDMSCSGRCFTIKHFEIRHRFIQQDYISKLRRLVVEDSFSKTTYQSYVDS